MPTGEVLEGIAKNEKFSGIAAVSGMAPVCNLDGVSAATPFAIHSVGKILSGVLMVEMVAQGIVSEAALITPGIKLPPEVATKLAASSLDSEEKSKVKGDVVERLSQVSILQAMTHKANLGDYLSNYTNHLLAGGAEKGSMIDMVEFAGNNWQPDYSNDGMLFGSLALQQLYNERTGADLSYENILQKLVIEPSETAISMVKTAAVHFKAEDSEHVAKFPATPAGGHFASVDDLLQLGKYLYERCKNPDFMAAVTKYGGEFYSEKRNRIEHSGYMEGSTGEKSSSVVECGVSLDDGKVIVVFNDRDASLVDRKEGGVTRPYAQDFYRELRTSLEQEKAENKQFWAEKMAEKRSGVKLGSFVEQVMKDKEKVADGVPKL